MEQTRICVMKKEKCFASRQGEVKIDMVELFKNAKPISSSDSKAKTPAKDKPDNGDKSEDKVASPKKSESGVPSYGKAKDCADFVRNETPDTKNAILGLLKRNKISCYEVPSKCPEMLKDKSGEALRNASKALQIYGIFCYQ